MAKTDLTNVLVSVFLKFKYMGNLGEIQFSFPFSSLSLDYFDVQDLKILLGIILFEIIVASSRHYDLKRCIFCLMLDRIYIYKTLNFESVNPLAEIEVSFINSEKFDNL